MAVLRLTKQPCALLYRSVSPTPQKYIAKTSQKNNTPCRKGLFPADSKCKNGAQTYPHSVFESASDADYLQTFSNTLLYWGGLNLSIHSPLTASSISFRIG